MQTARQLIDPDKVLDEALFYLISKRIPGYTRKDFESHPEEHAHDQDQYRAKSFSTFDALPDTELRRLFLQIFPLNRGHLPISANHNLFATNYGLEHPTFQNWILGKAEARDSRRAVINFFITGLSASPNVFMSTALNIKSINYLSTIYLFVDGDNLLTRAIPIFTFSRAWKDRVYANLFYRNDGFPAFVGVLQRLFGLVGSGSPLTLVGSYGTQKDASDVALTSTVVSLVTDNKFYEWTKEISIVTNDRFANEVVFTVDDLIKAYSITGNPVKGIDPKASTNDWYPEISYLDDEDNMPGGFTTWFIDFLINPHEVPVPIPEDYQEIVALIRWAKSGKAVTDYIRSKKGIRGYLLYQQYLVICGMKYLTSREILYFLTSRGLTSIFDDNNNRRLIDDNNQDNDHDPGVTYRVYQLTAKGLYLLNNHPFPDDLFWLYKVLSWTEAIQKRIINAALEVNHYDHAGGQITNVIFRRLRV